MSRVKNNNFDSWITRWAATADRVAAFAESEDRFGNTVSVRERFLRASNYYRMAVFYASRTDAGIPSRGDEAKTAFTAYHADGYCRRVCGYRIRESPAASLLVSWWQGRRPTLIAPGGFDSTMEELYCWLVPPPRPMAGTA